MSISKKLARSKLIKQAIRKFFLKEITESVKGRQKTKKLHIIINILSKYLYKLKVDQAKKQEFFNE